MICHTEIRISYRLEGVHEQGAEENNWIHEDLEKTA